MTKSKDEKISIATCLIPKLVGEVVIKGEKETMTKSIREESGGVAEKQVPVALGR